MVLGAQLHLVALGREANSKDIEMRLMRYLSIFSSNLLDSGPLCFFFLYSYRVELPVELANLQSRLWDPLINWFAHR